MNSRELGTLGEKLQLSELQGQNDQLRLLLGIQQRIGCERDLNKLLPLVMTEISRLLGAERSSLFLFDWSTLALRSAFAQGVDDEPIVVPIRMGIVGLAILGRRLVNVGNAYAHPFFNAEIDQVTGFRTESLLVAPVVDAGGKVYGGIELINKRAGRFAGDDEEAIAAAAEALAAMAPESWGGEAAKTLLYDLRERVGSERVTLFYLDKEKGCLISVYAEGLVSQPIVLSLKLGIAGLVAVTGEELLIENAADDPRFDASVDLRTGYRTRTLLCLPLNNPAGETLGVVQVINKVADVFSSGDRELLRAIVSLVAVAIENAMLLADKERQFHSLLAVLAASIDAKDPLTAGHSTQVARYAVAIARELGFSDEELDVMQVAAILHDYGKIGIDDQVLKKAGRLTASEYEHIKQHASMTHGILEKIHFARKYRGVPLIAASHHECIDGSGYPQGLRGREIPFMAKILSVADVFEAVTADRHYRKGMSVEQAFAILDEGSGKRYDAVVIAALKRSWTNARPPAGDAA